MEDFGEKLEAGVTRGDLAGGTAEGAGLGSRWHQRACVGEEGG